MGNLEGIFGEVLFAMPPVAVADLVFIWYVCMEGCVYRVCPTLV